MRIPDVNVKRTGPRLIEEEVRQGSVQNLDGPITSESNNAAKITEDLLNMTRLVTKMPLDPSRVNEATLGAW